MLLALAAGALLVQCKRRDYSKERWGVIVLYEKAGTCTHLAGPPRISAYGGDQITWRIYNGCGKDVTIEITDPRLSPSDDDGFTYANTWEKIKAVKQKRQDKERHKPRDPFGPGNKSRRVVAGSIEDLALTVKDDAQSGLYTYLVALDGVTDEADIDIWPPRP
jgi:hypothetical protein